MELVGVDEREPGQYPCIDPITFGVALIIAAEVGDLLAVDRVDWNRLART